MTNPDPVEAALEARIGAARKAGQNLTDLQIAMLRIALSVDPKDNRDSGHQYNQIEDAIRREGAWSDSYEWRIMTYNDVRIELANLPEGQRYRVEVACGDQKLSCSCRNLRTAFVYMRLYERLIMQGFYSVGPPWL